MSKWSELEDWYKVDFPIKRVLTNEQRTKYDAKAHVVTEHLMLEFKYVPGELGKHIYLFRNELEAKQFDNMTDGVGKVLQNA